MKMLRWLSKIMIATILISTLSVLTTWHVVNLYIEEILRQYQLPALGNKIQFSDFTARLSEELNIVNPGDRDIAEEKKNSVVENGSSLNKEGEGNRSPSPVTTAPEASSEPNSQGSTSDKPIEDAVAVWGRVGHESGGTDSAAELQREIVMSTEEFSEKKEQLTNEDKMQIFTLVIAKLPQSEVQHLSTLLENGITGKEMQEVEQTLQKHLNQEEYQQLMTIINKY
jgi:hypothetical protein